MRDRSAKETVKNENYNNDVEYTTQICRWALQPIGVWSLIQTNVTRVQKLVSTILLIACSSAVCSVIITCVLYIVLDEKDVRVKVKLFGPVGFLAFSLAKYFYLGLRSNSFRSCFEYVKDDWKKVDDAEHREVMLRNATVGRNLTIICMGFFYTGGLSYHFALPYFSNKQNLANNITMRLLMYPGYERFFYTQSSPVYEILIFYHCTAAMVSYNTTVAACSLAAIFVTHACGQTQIVMLRLSDLIEGKKSKGTKMKDRLAIIVEKHVSILRFLERVEEVLNEVCLLEIVACTLIICLVEYYSIMEWENNDALGISIYVELVITFSFEIFIFCYIGEILVQQCTEVGATSYSIDWYYLPEKEALDLSMLIMISNYPPKLTAGKVIELSFDTFGAVLKTSLAYLNLLRTVTE